MLVALFLSRCVTHYEGFLHWCIRIVTDTACTAIVDILKDGAVWSLNLAPEVKMVVTFAVRSLASNLIVTSSHFHIDGSG